MNNIGWGIITPTPDSVINEPLNNLKRDAIFKSIPLLLIILIFGWYFTNNLSKPLNQLAKYSEMASRLRESRVSTNQFKIKSNIYEVRQLSKHLKNQLRLLNKQIQQDGLTGIANRRAFDADMNQLFKEKIPFSLILIDIDHFKRVNDTYGHLIGDDVLIFIAKLIQSSVPGNVVCYRYGGEEFTLICMHMNAEKAYELAEYLREKIYDAKIPSQNPITISLGVAEYCGKDENPENLIHKADMAMYQSKADGRNRTTIYSDKLCSLHE